MGMRVCVRVLYGGVLDYGCSALRAHDGGSNRAFSPLYGWEERFRKYTGNDKSPSDPYWSCMVWCFLVLMYQINAVVVCAF